MYLENIMIGIISIIESFKLNSVTLHKKMLQKPIYRDLITKIKEK